MKKTREMMSRGKTPGKGRWIEGYYVGKTPFELQGSLIATWNFNPDDKKAFGQLVTHLVIPETVGRCTGQPDKNGRTAFEDDLIKNFGDIGVIRYGEYKNPFNDDKFTKHIGFYVEWLSGSDKDTLRMDLGYWLPVVEIVGNIHDNPEMLKAATGEDAGNAAQDTLLPAT